MSEVSTQRRPAAGLDETFGRLSPPFFDEQNDGDLLAELFRIIAAQDEPHGQEEPQRDVFAPSNNFAVSEGAPPDQASADDTKPARAEQRSASSDCAEPQTSAAEEKRTNAQVPYISGDFAAIEAGLLGGLRDDAEAAVSQTGKAHVSPSLELAPEQRPIAGDRPDTKRDGVPRRARLLRPRYLIAPLLVLALGSAAVKFGLDAPHPTPTDSAAVDAGNTAEMPQMAAASGTPDPVSDGGGLSQAPAEAEAPAALSGAQRDDFSAVAPVAVEQPAPQTAEPVSAAGPVEPNAVLSQPGTPSPLSGTLAQAKTEEAPPPAPQAGAAGNAPGTRPAAQLVKPPVAHKSRHPAGQGHTRHVAKNINASPGRPPAAGAAPGTEKTTETPTPQPATEAGRANSDPLALVQGALNSFANATAKLFEPGQR
jgi:hypothetical protein